MTTVPALTALRLGYKDPLTDTFGAHPLLGAVLDLNDGQMFTLATPDGFTLSAPRRTLVPVGNIRTQGEAVSRGVYQHNRTARVRVTLGPLASYASLTSALRTLLHWLDAPPGIPFTLQYQAPNASAPTYLDVVGCAHTLPLEEEQWLRLQLEPVEITFLVRPGLKGDRVTLQNLAPNPGFEQGAGPAVLVFSDNFANINAYAVQAGSAPTVASSVMTLVAGARVALGSPAWSHLNLWQLRFKWVTGLAARFYLHYTDANNHLRAEATGTSWALIHTVAGTPTTIATGAVTLTNSNFYWIKVTQFPWPAPSATVAPPYLTASLFNDSAGAVGSLVVNGALAGPAVDGVTALSGRPQIEAVGASLQLGGAFGGVHTVSLFGPGGWQTIPQAGAATGFSSGAWEQAAANTISTGPVTSFGAARVDLAPAGTVDFEWRVYTGGSPTGTWAIPVRVAGDSIGISVYSRSSGLGVSCTRRIMAREYDASGTLLRTDTGWTPPSLTGNTASWLAAPNLSGTYVTGASCAYLDISLRVSDSNAGQSANGIVWWENLLAWNISQCGATMSYCELRFPQSPAQLLVTGLLGDLPAPASCALGGFISGLPAGGSLQLVVGRRGQFSAGAALVGPTYGYYGTALSPQSTATLDATSYGGWYANLAALTSAGWNPRAFSFRPSDARGVYHLYTRLRSQQSVGNLPNLTARAAIQQLLSPWYGQSGGADQLATYSGGYVTPLVASNAWTAADVGQVAVPPFPVGTLTDLAQTYLTPRAQLGRFQRLVGGGAGGLGGVGSGGWRAADGAGEQSVNAPFAVTNQWLWTYFDGLGMAAGGDPAWTYSLESSAQPNAARGAAGPGTQTSGNINVNSGADPALTLDPTLENPAGLSANQLVALLTDNNAVVLGVACEISYTPLYLWPR